MFVFGGDQDCLLSSRWLIRDYHYDEFLSIVLYSKKYN